MKKVAKLIVTSAQSLNVLSCIGMVAMMLLVVSNVLMRVLFRAPIFGTFEYVGFITAIVISFSIAYCGLKGGHIAVDLFVEKFPRKVQLVIDSVLGFVSTFFLGLFAWQMARYGASLLIGGELSSTTRTPLYIFVYLVSFGLLLLTLVVLLKTIRLFYSKK